LIDISHKLHPIRHHHHFHRRVTDVLIAINKRMVLDQQKTQARNLLQKRRIDINPTKGLPRLTK